MLVFIIPLKSPQVVKSWDFVSRLFERCIKSVCNQTSADFRVIVVCHEEPNIEFTHPNISYIKVDFPVPQPNPKAKYMDKVNKISTGLIHASKFKPSHTMIVDADDCVSKNLAEFVNQNPQTDGWFLNKGYLHREGTNFIYVRRENFYQWCGTCGIIRYDLHSLPQSSESNFTDINNLHCPHNLVVENMAHQGRPLKALPFAGAIYIVCHGDQEKNFENTIKPVSILPRIKKILFNYRFVTKSIRDEFSFYNL